MDNDQEHLINTMTPGASMAGLGSLIRSLYDRLQQQETQYNALLAHLDTANVAGIGNANAATFGIATTVNCSEQN